eukprot:680342_1
MHKHYILSRQVANCTFSSVKVLINSIMGACSTKIQKEKTNQTCSPQLIKSTNKQLHEIICSNPRNKFEETQAKNQMLVYGFVEQNYHHHSEYSVPIAVDIIDLILRFFDDMFYWSFEDDSETIQHHKSCNNISFNRFLNTTNGETIWSEPIEIKKGIIFQYSACPDGWFPFQKGWVQFYLEVISIPTNVKEIDVNFRVFCKEIENCTWSDKNRFNRIPQAVGWPRYNMKLSECRKYNSLHFCCALKITEIRYKSDCDSIQLKGFDDIDDENALTGIHNLDQYHISHPIQYYSLHSDDNSHSDHIDFSLTIDD